MSERDITGNVDEGADRAISGMDRTLEADETAERKASARRNNDLEAGEDWAEDRTQDSWEEGGVRPPQDSSLREAGNA